MRWVTRDHYRKENSFNFNIEADLEKKGGGGRDMATFRSYWLCISHSKKSDNTFYDR